MPVVIRPIPVQLSSQRFMSVCSGGSGRPRVSRRATARAVTRSDRRRARSDAGRLVEPARTFNLSALLQRVSDLWFEVLPCPFVPPSLQHHAEYTLETEQECRS